MKLVITEHENLSVGYMDFTKSSELLYEYMKEVYIFYCGLTKPLYVYFADMTLILSSKKTQYEHPMYPALPNKDEMPDAYWYIKFDPTVEDLAMEVRKNQMSEKTLNKLNKALTLYKHEMRTIIIPTEVIGV